MEPGLPPPGPGCHCVRRGSAQREDPVPGAVLLPVEHEPVPGAAVCPVRQDHGIGAAEPAGLGAAGAGRAGVSVGGAAGTEPADGAVWPGGEHLLPVRGDGRGQRRPDPGDHPGGGAAGRGGPDAPVLCGAGLRPVLGDGGQVLVLLQPGGAGALVLPGMDLQGGGTEPSPPAVSDGGQPHPLPGDPTAV